MATKRKRLRTTDYGSRGTSNDDMPVEQTIPPTPTRSSSEEQRCSVKKNKNKGKIIQILVKLKDEMTSEMRKLLENHIESNNNQSIMLGKNLEKLTESLEKLTESHNDLRKQWEIHTNAPRSQWNQEQPPRYRLVFKSNVTEKIEKGQTIEIHVALVDANNGQTVKNGPLASATVELVVIDAKFNQNDNQYNWSIEDFMSCIKKARQGNSATVNVDQSGKSIVSNGRFNLENGDKRHCNFTIFSNSSNKKVRLGVMVVSPTQERVLEGLSNPFFVRGHDRPNRTQAGVDSGNPEQNGSMSNVQNPSCPNSTQTGGNGLGINPMLGGQHQSLSQINAHVLSTEPATCQQYQVPHRSMVHEAWNNQIGVRDGCPEQNGTMPHMHNPLWQNSTQGPDTIRQTQIHYTGNTDITYTEPSASQVQQAWIPQNQDQWRNLTHQPLNNGTGTPFYTNQTTFPVRIILDTPSVVPSKHCLNLLDQFMPQHSWQPKFYNCGLPTACLMPKQFGSLTTMPKEVMETRRQRGVVIEPLEPDDSDERRPLKRKLHSKYHLRFVNKVCETYYTWDQIKANEGNLLKVALFDENNMKITSGPLSSASVVVVALHGDFNCDGHDYWTSEDFNRSVVCPPPGEEASSVVGGVCILVLAGGEACLSDAFFQITSFCARTGKFKMGVMLASAQEERIQEGISEPFRVMDHRLAGECGRVFGKRPEEDSASINHPSVARALIWHLLSMVKASSYLMDQYKVMEGMEKQQKNIERMLLEILDIIEDAEEKGAFHDVVSPYLSDLKKVAYEANDIFDEFKYEALQRESKKVHHSMLGTEVLRDRNPIVFCYRMSNNLCKIVKTIEVLVTKMNALGFRHMQQAPPSKQLMKTEPILFDSDMDIVRRSRDKEKNKIMRMLLHEASNMDLTILPIVGMGGLGKTTLAKLIYNDPVIEKHFELQRWCCVSQDFDASIIANKICQTNVNDQDREKALEDLRSILSGKRYLIVLDDIWNMDETKWGQLMTCLKQGGKGSVVLTTTRYAEVARIIKMGAAEAYNIEKLSPKHLKEIVLSKAFSVQKPNSDKLDGIVDMIVDRCAGCPLAAKILGSLVSTKTSLEEWEAISDEGSPICMTRESLKKITKNFSQLIGSGTFGKVYKGVQDNGEKIAVKKFPLTHQNVDYLEEFKKEFNILRRIKHRNIVKLLGYCYEDKGELVKHEGQEIFAHDLFMALCFEYMENGSLEKHLHDESGGMDWQTRYKIIKGTCNGLQYLHDGLDIPIYHLDLKPGNILLSETNVPKIADFGLSRRLVLDNRTEATTSFKATWRYCPPEYRNGGDSFLFSNKYDIFSLGVVMMDIIAGIKGYNNINDKKFIDQVQENWGKKIQPLEYECVKRCIEIALTCVDADRAKRPEIGDIIRMLNETEKMPRNWPQLLPLTKRDRDMTLL